MNYIIEKEYNVVLVMIDKLIIYFYIILFKYKYIVEYLKIFMLKYQSRLATTKTNSLHLIT